MPICKRYEICGFELKLVCSYNNYTLSVYVYRAISAGYHIFQGILEYEEFYIKYLKIILCEIGLKNSEYKHVFVKNICY